MDPIDRGVIVLHPRQPFLDWINRTGGLSDRVTIEELQEDPTTLLVPNLPTLQDMLDYVRPLKPRLFELKLEGWYTDRSTWPEKRTEALFDAWFELRAHSEVYDLVDPPDTEHESGLPAKLAGTWRVVSSPDFDDDYLYMETTPYVQLQWAGDELKGDFQVGLIAGSLWGIVDGAHVRFRFDAVDEMDPVHGAGTIVGQGEQMTFTLEFYDGDSYRFECAREDEQD